MFAEISTSTLIICVIVFLLFSIAITLFVLVSYSGLFTNIKDVGTGKPPLGKVVIAYKFVQGPYKEAGQTFTEAHVLAPDNKSLGIYYDDPNKVPAKDLRYAVGSILASDESEVDSEILSRFTSRGFKTVTLPEVEFVVKTSFPHVSTLSILIGIHKAYPRLAEYIEERKLCAYPFLEYYDGTDIHFLAPLSKQEEFWVPECQKTDGRGDEMVLDSSDVNTTLETSQSVLSDESMEVTPVRAMPGDTTDSCPASPDSLAMLEISQISAETVDSDTVGEDAKEDEGSDGTGGVVDGEGDDDNSSSSSFEVLKNEGVE